MIGLFLGHLVGDYFLQNNWMALNKSKNTLIGWMAALLHCIIYTWCVCLFMWNFDWYWWVVVFITHFPIDKFSLGWWYMKHIKGYDVQKYIENVNNPTINQYMNHDSAKDILSGGFLAVVYTITDNTMHLVLMWVAYQLIY